MTTLGEISGSLAHELNQPLGAILANTEAIELSLRKPAPPLEDVRPILADIRRDALRAGEIIHGMHDFLRRRELDIRPLELEALAGDAVKLVSGETLARQVTVKVDIPDKLPRVMADRTCITQVFVNLLVNSMDAMSLCSVPNRCVTIGARQRDPLTIEVWVADAGIGILAADLGRLFEPFHTTKRDGLGLGLAICRSIIETHGGSMSVANNPDRGATARFTLMACGQHASVSMDPQAGPPLTA